VQDFVEDTLKEHVDVYTPSLRRRLTWGVRIW
jgi:hypothetical protein